MIDIQISDSPLDISTCISQAMSAGTGGINVFIGTVRNFTNGREVVKLEFEAYESMALLEIKKIANEMMQTWQLDNIIVHHRVGVLEVGDVPVIIVVSAAHRDDAFKACRFAIDTLKKTVPIWKKEFFKDGEQWVSAHP